MVFLSFLNFVLLFLPLCIYTFVAWKRRDFKLFNPFFFPLVLFSFYYGIPSLANLFISKSIYNNAIYIQFLATVSYLAGTGLYKLKKNKKRKRSHKKVFIANSVVMKLFFVVGISMLILYGYWTGVTGGLLTGKDVEGVRRIAEIGKGFLKHPGIFFITFPALWLFGASMVENKKLCISNISLLLFGIVTIFFTTAHKASAFWIILLAIGLYDKFKFSSPVKIFIAGIFIVFFIGSANILRRAETADSTTSIFNKSILSFSGVYNANYVPIVKRVDQKRFKLQWGKEYIQNATLIIPRFLYPTKPINFDYFIKEELDLSFRGGGAPATPFGSLYINFSFYGVVIGMFLIGYIYFLLYERYRTENNLTKSLIFLFVLTYILNPSLFLANTLLLFLFLSFILITDNIISHATRGVKMKLENTCLKRSEGESSFS